MRLTPKQVEAMRDTLKAELESGDVELTIGDESNARFLFRLLSAHPRGMTIASFPGDFANIVHHTIQNAHEHCSTRTFNALAVSAMKAGLAPIH